MKRIVVYPGTFDPVTFGHLDIIERSLELFDEVIVAVTTRSSKKPLFSLKQMVALLKQCTAQFNRVEVKSFSGLLVDFTKKQKAEAIIRGLRELSDFEIEFQQAIVNRKLAPSLETVFIATSPKYFHLNSTMVEEIASMHGKFECFVRKPVFLALKKKFK